MSEITRVAAGLVTGDDGRILLARRAPGERLAGKWEFPGGKLEPGETAENCLVREFQEEFGVTIEVGEFVVASRFDYEHLSIELLAYTARHTGGAFTPTVHDELRWAHPAEMRELDLADADIPIVDTLIERAQPRAR